MGSQDMLVMAMALPPVWISARLWWSTRHSMGELQDSWAPGPHPGAASGLPIAGTGPALAVPEGTIEQN